MGDPMDPDEQVQQHQQTVTERQRLNQIEQMKQSVQPFVQSANSGGFGISANAGKALLDAIHSCQDGLDRAQLHVARIQQDTKLGTSPDAMVITAFNKEVAAGGADSAVTSLAGLREVLSQAEAGVAEAMKHYRSTDHSGAGHVRRAGS
jgi:hypothetical protein